MERIAVNGIKRFSFSSFEKTIGMGTLSNHSLTVTCLLRLSHFTSIEFVNNMSKRNRFCLISTNISVGKVLTNTFSRRNSCVTADSVQFGS